MTTEQGDAGTRVEIAAARAATTIFWIGGNCPVQAEGEIGGARFYFRARGGAWSLSIGGEDIILGPKWFYKEAYKKWPLAGWMPEEEAINFIYEAAARYLADPAPEARHE